jgi:hypothetical protein
MVHQQQRAFLEVKGVRHLLVVSFNGEFNRATFEISVVSDSVLVCHLRFDIRIAEFPNVRWRDGRCIGEHLNVLTHSGVTDLE